MPVLGQSVCRGMARRLQAKLLQHPASGCLYSFTCYAAVYEKILKENLEMICMHWLRLLQSGGQMAGVRFLKHNIRDDFDDLTDVARLYGVRAVPCFVFFIGGAQVGLCKSIAPNAEQCLRSPRPAFLEWMLLCSLLMR